MKKIIIYGGSFNPVHRGHLQIVEKLHQLSFDEILLIPTSSSKNINISFPDKINMLSTSIKSRAEIILLEKKISATPTIQTLIRLKNIYKFEKISLCIGEDNFVIFHKWVNFARVLGFLDKLVIFGRQNYKREPENRYLRYLLANQSELFLFIPFDENISSSEIRENLQKKDYNDKLEKKLDYKTFNYIKKTNLYKL